MCHICPRGCVVLCCDRWPCKMSDCTSDAGCMMTHLHCCCYCCTPSSEQGPSCVHKNAQSHWTQVKDTGEVETGGGVVKHASMQASLPAPCTGSHKGHLNLTYEDKHFHISTLRFISIQFLIIGGSLKMYIGLRDWGEVLTWVKLLSWFVAHSGGQWFTSIHLGAS